jgi:hypothetical protein
MSKQPEQTGVVLRDTPRVRTPKTPEQVEGRLYYAYTPHALVELVKEAGGGNMERATVAVKKVGDEFHYGIAICNPDDQFERTKGRVIAEQRANEGFAKVDATWFPKEGEDWEQSIIRFANGLVESAAIKPERFKRKICKNCK